MMDMLFVLLFAGLAFTLSASAGLGGSLIMVPALALLLGAKEGIALAALLLAANNVSKTWFYRQTVPWRQASLLLAMTMFGTFIGSALLVAAPEALVDAAIVLCLVSAFALEQRKVSRVRQGLAPVLALASGATSGFSGTSGPLKGIAIRSLDLDRMHLVGAASVISLAGDAIKSAVFAHAQLLDERSLTIALAAVPLMIGASYLGRSINQTIGERAFAVLFWTVICGYAVRLAIV